VCHALSLPEGHSADTIPVGGYTIPEVASIGLDEMASQKQYREVMIGRARFNEIARGQISCIHNGLLKMVADPTGEHLLGVQIVGEGATRGTDDGARFPELRTLGPSVFSLQTASPVNNPTARKRASITSRICR